jgi:hypothetical protein
MSGNVGSRNGSTRQLLTASNVQCPKLYFGSVIEHSLWKIFRERPTVVWGHQYSFLGQGLLVAAPGIV